MMPVKIVVQEVKKPPPRKAIQMLLLDLGFDIKQHVDIPKLVADIAKVKASNQAEKEQSNKDKADASEKSDVVKPKKGKGIVSHAAEWTEVRMEMLKQGVEMYGDSYNSFTLTYCRR
jgi:hypothetical protein